MFTGKTCKFNKKHCFVSAINLHVYYRLRVRCGLFSLRQIVHFIFLRTNKRKNTWRDEQSSPGPNMSTVAYEYNVSKIFLGPNSNPDHHQNLITSLLCYGWHLLKIFIQTLPAL